RTSRVQKLRSEFVRHLVKAAGEFPITVFELVLKLLHHSGLDLLILSCGVPDPAATLISHVLLSNHRSSGRHRDLRLVTKLRLCHPYVFAEGHGYYPALRSWVRS